MGLYMGPVVAEIELMKLFCIFNCLLKIASGNTGMDTEYGCSLKLS